VTYPDGYAVSYTYSGIDDAVSRLTSLTGLPATGSTTPVTLEAFKYLGAGTLIERSRPEVDVALSMVSQSGSTGDAGDQYTGLDRFGRVVDQRWLTGSGSTATDVDRYGYTYDRNSNRLTRSNALASAFSETYSYDALNQLQGFIRGSTSSPSTTQDWEFDALGNWTTVSTDGVDQTRTANAQNELTQVGSASLAYSTTGNLTTDAQGRILVYDAWNRLVSVNNASAAQVARYEYDGMNRRIVEQAGTLTTPAAVSAAVRDLFYSLNWQVLEERVRDAAGAIPAVADTRYVWSPVYVDALIARDRNTDGNITTGTGGLEERVYALQDANWNTTGIVAATGISGLTLGNVFTRFVYTPYGESQTLTASWGTPAAGSAPITPWSHLFQGLKLTDVTGLAYVRHRDYSPTMGRFIERDPIGFEAGDSNWYRFVANEATVKTDPSGLCELDPDVTGPCRLMIYAGHWGPDAEAFIAQNRGPDNDKTGCGPYLSFVSCFSSDYTNRLGAANLIPNSPSWRDVLKAKHAIGGLKNAIEGAREFAKRLCNNRKSFCDDGTTERYQCGEKDQRCDSVTITVTCDTAMKTLTTTGMFGGKPVEIFPGQFLKTPNEEVRKLCETSIRIDCRK
jgi:RHS repeat-associated protein